MVRVRNIARFHTELDHVNGYANQRCKVNRQRPKKKAVKTLLINGALPNDQTSIDLFDLLVFIQSDQQNHAMLLALAIEIGWSK